MKPGFDHVTRACCALIFALLVVAGTLHADILYRAADPRIRLTGGTR